MSMQVLHSRQQIRAARKELKRRGLSAVGSPLARMLHGMGLSSGVCLGDTLKSWDVLRTVDFIVGHLPRDAAILDIGCYASEMLPVLHGASFSNLAGADLNPRVEEMPHGDAINYTVTDFMATPFADESFAAITAISVIEHGYEEQRLLAEVSRLLKPGGYFLASFDYWPEKIVTNGIKFFDMSWQIFSRAEAEQLVETAAGLGLSPVGELHTEADDRPISCAGKDYTFAWLVLQKAS